MMGRVNIKDKKIQKTKFCFLLLTSYFLLLKKKAQVMLEFTFCMIILFLMMYGIVMVFRWVGLDLGQRQQAHETLLTTDIVEDYGECAISIPFMGGCVVWSLNSAVVAAGPLSQIDPFFYQPGPMNAVWRGD